MVDRGGNGVFATLLVDCGLETVSVVDVVDHSLAAVGLVERVESLDVVSVAVLFLFLNVVGLRVVDAVREFVGRVDVGVRLVAVTSVGLRGVAVRSWCVAGRWSRFHGG